MARELTYQDLCEILSIKCYVKESTVARFIEHFILLIASELQNNSSISIKNFGKFSVDMKGGKDEWLRDSFGKMTKQYVEPFKYIDFEPSQNLLNVVNGQNLSSFFDRKIVKYDTPVAYEDIINDKISYDLSDDIKKILSSKQKEPSREMTKYIQFDKVNQQRRRRILCKTTNVIYPSVYKAAVDLGLDYRILKEHTCGNIGDMKFHGYEFELLDDKEDNKKKKKKEREEDNNGKV